MSFLLFFTISSFFFFSFIFHVVALFGFEGVNCYAPLAQLARAPDS